MGIGKSTDPKSAIQQVRDAIALDEAEGYNLDQITNNLGFPRPFFGWQRDDNFRAAARQFAVQVKTSRVALHKLVELILGPDQTKVKTLYAGEGTPAVLTGTVAQTYAITAGVNDQLHIRAQGAPGVTVTLTTGGAVTAATIAADINGVDGLQVSAAAVVTGAGTVVELTATGSVVGIDSIIELSTIARSAHATLGFSTVVHGREDVGIGSYLVAIDDPSYISADAFPQVAKELVIDEHGATEETLSYRFLEPIRRVIALEDTFAQKHAKYLPFEGTELVLAVSAGQTTITVADTTGFPTLAAPVAGEDDEFMGILINRGQPNEEYIKVEQTSGSLWTLATGLQFDHKVNESVERAFDADSTPQITILAAAGATELTVNDSSLFPKVNFTIIVERGTDREETFWIGENDITGATSGTPNTLIIDGTQQSTAPSVTAFEHAIGSAVEPAQLQLKECGWRIVETRATGEVLIVVPEDCIPAPDGFQHAFLHEEIEPGSLSVETGIVAVALTEDVTAADHFFRVNIADLDKLWGGPTVPPGPRVQSFEDLKRLNRSVLVTDGTNSEERYVSDFRQSSYLVRNVVNGVETGYAIGATVLKIEDVTQFRNLFAGSFDVRINRSGGTDEVVTVASVDEVAGTFTLSAGLANEHCTFDDLDAPADRSGEVKERIEYSNTAVALITGSPFENAYVAASTTATIINTPNFLYDTGVVDSFGQSVPAAADNLQDAGWLPEGEGQSPQNGRFWGYYLSEDASRMPRSITTRLSPALSLSHPEAINEIPEPTELIGWCTDLTGNGFSEGTISAGKSFLVLADVRMWPGSGGVSPFPYPIRIDDVLYDVSAKNNNPINLPNPYTELGPTFQLGVIELFQPTTETHEGLDTATGRRGTKVFLRVEQILVENAQHFPVSGGAAFIDFGHGNEEFFVYSSRSGNALIVDDLEFRYQHPGNKAPFSADIYPHFANVPSVSNIVLALNEHSFGNDGYDHPIYLPGDPLEALLGVAPGIPGMADLLRAAGIKVNVHVTRIPEVALPLLPPLLSFAELLLTAGTEGQTSTVTEGGTYKYSVTYGRWFRDEVYDLLDRFGPAAAQLGDISGTVVPASETPAWTDNTAAGGTITSNGTKVTWDSIGTGTSGQAFSSLTHSEPDGHSLFVDGYFEVIQVDGSDTITRAQIVLPDGDRIMRINLAHAAGGGVRIVNDVNTAIGNVNDSVSITGTERYIEVLTDFPAGTCKVWIDNVAGANLDVAYTSLPTTTSKTFIVADQTNVSEANVEMTARGVEFWRIN